MASPSREGAFSAWEETRCSVMVAGFCIYFETELLYVTQANLGLAMYTRLTLSPRDPLASASQVWCLKRCTTTLDTYIYFYTYSVAQADLELDTPASFFSLLRAGITPVNHHGHLCV